MLMVLIFGAIDFGRAIYMRQVLINLSRETANLEARGTGSTTQEIMTNALSAAIQEALPLALNSSNGYVVVTAVTNFGAHFTISQQYNSGTLHRVPPVPRGNKHKCWQHGGFTKYERFDSTGKSHRLCGRGLL